MFRDEGDGRDEDADALRPRQANLVVRRGPDPFQGANPALVTDLPVHELWQVRSDGGGRGLHLRLVGVSSSDHPLGKAVGGEEETKSRRPTGRFPDAPDSARVRLSQAVRDRIAADGAAPARPLIGLVPVLEGGLCRRGGELGVEGQEHHLVRSEREDLPRRLGGEGLPVPHGHEDPDLIARASPDQLRLQGLGLLPGLRQKRGSAPHEGVVGPGALGAGGRDEGGEGIAHRGGRADDGLVAEEVEQEGTHRVRPVRSTQVEEDDGQTGHLPVILRTARSMWATGVSGRTPCPRLKM